MIICNLSRKYLRVFLDDAAGSRRPPEGRAVQELPREDAGAPLHGPEDPRHPRRRPRRHGPGNGSGEGEEHQSFFWPSGLLRSKVLFCMRVCACVCCVCMLCTWRPAPSHIETGGGSHAPFILHNITLLRCQPSGSSLHHEYSLGSYVQSAAAGPCRNGENLAQQLGTLVQLRVILHQFIAQYSRPLLFSALSLGLC